MFKSVFVLFICLFVFKGAFAQKNETDTVFYYVNNNGDEVATKDSANYFIIVLPPDTTISKDLFPVQEFYKNGKLRLIGTSSTQNLDLKFEGSKITYFPNGHKAIIANYVNGKVVGDMYKYYPNGKLYSILKFEDGKIALHNECRDSTGKVLTENGNGTWIQFCDEDFNAYLIGRVIDGHEDGEWIGRHDNIDALIWVYKDGKWVSEKILNVQQYKYIVHIELRAEFPGGNKNFQIFISKNVRYPEKAKNKGTNGIVLVAFTVEKNGILTNIRVLRGIGDGCDEEAIRVIRLSPPWKPGLKNSEPATFEFTVPVTFPSVH